MSGKRQKTQYSLALEPTDRGEAPVGGCKGPNLGRSQRPKARLGRNN